MRIQRGVILLEIFASEKMTADRVGRSHGAESASTRIEHEIAGLGSCIDDRGLQTDRLGVRMDFSLVGLAPNVGNISPRPRALDARASGTS